MTVDQKAQVANAREEQQMSNENETQRGALPADIESTWELTEEERIALPAEYHQPVWMDLTTPKLWICAQCWGEGTMTGWPCEVAAKHGKSVAVAGGMKVAA